MSDPAAAFTTFVNRVLVPASAQRFAALVGSDRGQHKALEALYHGFEPGLRPAAIKPKAYDRLWNQPCFVYSTTKGFGVPFPSVRTAYDSLTLLDGWLILLTDGSAGIYRPEGRWDDERYLAG